MFQKQLEEARSLAMPIPHNFSGVDTFPAFVIQAVTFPDDEISAATLAFVQGGDMTLLVDAAAPTGKWAFGTAGVLDTSAAAYDTVGELYDYIKGIRGLRMYLVGARRSTTMAKILAKTAASCFGDNGLTFYFDASASDEGAVAISGEKFVNNGINGHVTDWDSQCENSLCNLNITCGLTGNGNLKIYSGKEGATEVEMLSFAMTDDTNINKGLDQPDAPWATAPRGHRLIVSVQATTSLDDIAICDITGKTAVVKNDRIVTEKNY